MTTAVLQPSSPTLSTDRWSLAPHRAPARMRDCQLIAVATAGDRVDCGFDEAESFLLFEKVDGRASYVGCQLCPLASPGDQARRARLFADCDLVLCATISDTGRHVLSHLGIGCSLDFAGVRVSDAVSAVAAVPA
jgi:hypothetical protein